MAFGNVPHASSGDLASSGDYNQLIDNVDNLDTRLDTAENTVAIVDARTTNTSGTVGIGNQRLSDRLGASITTASTAAAQIGANGTNITTLQGQVGAAPSSPNLHSRVSTLEAASTVSPIVRATRLSAAAVNTAQNVYTYVPWTAAPRNPNTMWAGGNPNRLTVPAGQGGLYYVNAMILILPSTVNAANTGKAIGIRINGAGTILRAGAPLIGVSGNYIEAVVQMHIELSASDYIEIGVWHNYATPSEITIGSDAGAPWVVMRKVAS